MTVASKSSARAKAPIEVAVPMAGDDPSAVEAQRISGEIAIDRAAVRRASLVPPLDASVVSDTSDDDAVASADGPASDPAAPASV